MSIVWKEPIVALRAGKFMHAEGIIIGIPTPVDVTLADAKEFVAQFYLFEPAGNWRILIDQRGVSRKLEAAAREHLTASVKDQLAALAIVTGNTVSRFFASGIIAAIGMRSKARAFDSDDEALAWLKSLGAAASPRR